MAKKDDIMQATLELVAERGFHNTPTALIAQQAGAAEGTIFRHFKTTAGLLAAVFEQELDAVKKSVVVALRQDRDIAGNFIILGTAFIDYFLRHPKTFLYIEQYLNSPAGRENRKRWLYSDEDGDIESHPLVGFLELGKKQGAIKPLSNVVLLSMVYGPIAFLLKESLFGDSNIRTEDFQSVLAICWAGIRNHNPAPG